MSITFSIIYSTLFRQSNYPDLIIFLNDDILSKYKQEKFSLDEVELRYISSINYDLFL